MSFYLLQCHPDPHAIAVWGTRRRLLSPDGDTGYVFHALLRTVFGERSPQPFRDLGSGRGLLSYTTMHPDRLRECAALALPDVNQVLGLQSLAIKPYPTTWRAGQCLAFESRVRPILRTKDGRERDVFLHAIETTRADGMDRAAIYTDWIAQQIASTGAAQIDEVSIESFRLSRVMRQANNDDSAHRRPRLFMGPDVLFKGRLRIVDGNAFARLLERGIGRHRAFGFGMLLLKPTASC